MIFQVVLKVFAAFCFCNMQSILAILVSFSALRSSSADSQITTINEQHSVLKKCKISQNVFTLQLARTVQVDKFKRIFTLFKKGEDKSRPQKIRLFFTISTHSVGNNDHVSLHLECIDRTLNVFKDL